jgi:hypothetical protein
MVFAMISPVTAQLLSAPKGLGASQPLMVQLALAARVAGCCSINAQMRDNLTCQISDEHRSNGWLNLKLLNND